MSATHSTAVCTALAIKSRQIAARHMGVGYREALVEADWATWDAVARADAREGAQALLERRAPKFERLGSGQ